MLAHEVLAGSDLRFFLPGLLRGCTSRKRGDQITRPQSEQHVPPIPLVHMTPPHSSNIAISDWQLVDGSR